MNKVSLIDAKNRLSPLVDQVENGCEVTTTRRGDAVAKLVQAEVEGPASSITEEFQKLRAAIVARSQVFSQDEIRRDRDEGRR